MNYYFQDDINVRTNSVTIVGAGGPAYNAVIKADIADETGPEFITLQEAKDWCKIDVTDDDTLITKLIKAARLVCERFVNLSLIPRNVTAVIHNGLGGINLPYGPVTSEVAYFNVDDSEATGYDINTGSGDNITAVYSAGYAAGNLPEDLRTAVLDQIAWMYNNRGDVKLASALSLESVLTLKPLRDVS